MVRSIVGVVLLGASLFAWAEGLALNLKGATVAQLVQLVLGEFLRRDFVVTPAVAARKDTITVRVTALSQDGAVGFLSEVLGGLGIVLVERAGVVYVEVSGPSVPASALAGGQKPDILSAPPGASVNHLKTPNEVQRVSEVSGYLLADGVYHVVSDDGDAVASGVGVGAWGRSFEVAGVWHPMKPHRAAAGASGEAGEGRSLPIDQATSEDGESAPSGPSHGGGPGGTREAGGGPNGPTEPAPAPLPGAGAPGAAPAAGFGSPAGFPTFSLPAFKSSW